MHHVLSDLGEVRLRRDDVTHFVFGQEALGLTRLVRLPLGETLEVDEILVVDAWVWHPDVGEHVVGAV